MQQLFVGLLQKMSLVVALERGAHRMRAMLRLPFWFKCSPTSGKGSFGGVQSNRLDAAGKGDRGGRGLWVGSVLQGRQFKRHHTLGVSFRSFSLVACLLMKI